MTRAEQVTDFKLEEPDGKPVTFTAIIKAINDHCKDLMGGDCFTDKSKWDTPPVDIRLPACWRSLIAFAMDGDNEGYYVHVGVMVDFGYGDRPGEYLDIGFVKLWEAETAQRVATEAQRFLSASRWN
jgi:hypothetical protein